MYLGKKGGGLQLLLDTTYSLTQKGIQHYLIVSRVQMQRFQDMGIDIDSVTFIEIPHTLHDLVSPKKLLNNIVEILKLCIFALRIRDSLIVQIMPSPFDVLIDLFAMKKGNYIWRCIHDFEPHLGEKWPRKNAIKTRIKFAHTLVFFSNYVSEKVKFNVNSKRVVSLPFQFYRYGAVSIEVERIISELRKSSKGIYLCIGRIHEYKGINFISSVSEFAKKTNFILAGSGTTSHEISEEVTRISKWLSDSEFQDLIRVADVIVFPYLGSTQSGTIPLAINDGKIILVADVGGLPEQIRGYSKGFVFEHGNASSFLNSLERIQIQLERGEFNTKEIPGEGFTPLATLPDLIQEQLGLELEK